MRALALLALAACATSSAAPPVVESPPTVARGEAAALHAQVAATGDGHALPSLAVALIRDGEIVWSEGYAPIGQPIPTRTTTFRIGHDASLDELVSADGPWITRESPQLGPIKGYVASADHAGAVVFLPQRQLGVIVLVGVPQPEIAECLATALLLTSLGRPDLGHCAP